MSRPFGLSYNSNPVMRTAAVNLLKQFTEPDDPAGMQVELWGSDRTLRMALPESTAPFGVES